MHATPDDELRKIVEACHTLGSQAAAARALGIPRTTLVSRLETAALRGLMGTKPVLPGFGIKRTSAQLNDSGAVEKEWVTQAPIGEKFEVPDGHVVKGVSALVDPAGNTIQQWIKTRKDEVLKDAIEALEDVFEKYRGHATLPKAPRQTDRDLLTIYPVSDHHLGLYAWAEEAGENYDLVLGEKLLRETMTTLVAQAPDAEIGVVLNLGDFFHSDDNENRTRRSGNALDVDGRHAKVLRVGVNLMIHCVQLALQRHKRVVLRNLPGNHDQYAALALSIAMETFFRGSKRVTVDTDPSPYWWFKHGKVLLGSTHGDMAKATDMPGIMAAKQAKWWGETEYRYIYLGHVHHKSSGGERAGAIWETFQTLSPKDAWHNASGYVAGRSMVSITHHRNFGEVMRNTVSVKGPR